MSPIVTLTWENNVAYGPRGTRYEIISSGGGMHQTRVFSPENPQGELLDSVASYEDAQLSAQRHCEGRTAEVGAEAEAIASSGRTQL